VLLNNGLLKKEGQLQADPQAYFDAL